MIVVARQAISFTILRALETPELQGKCVRSTDTSPVAATGVVRSATSFALERALDTEEQLEGAGRAVKIELGQSLSRETIGLLKSVLIRLRATVWILLS